ncbi:hypothetical protein [Calothrix sp. NIES-2100]|uniref:hypothetical protein n=1 Tax=Calothrix sp. NIES-2100 TaxID=1954172 RepID=UPI000BBB7832
MQDVCPLDTLRERTTEYGLYSQAIASGCNAIVSGNNSIASRDNAIVSGNNSIVSGDNAIVSGYNSIASRENATALLCKINR